MQSVSVAAHVDLTDDKNETCYDKCSRTTVKRKLLSRLHTVNVFDHQGVAIVNAHGERKQCSPLSTSWNTAQSSTKMTFSHSSSNGSRPSGGTHKMERVYVSKRPDSTEMLRLDPNTGDPRVFLYKSGHKSAVQCQLEVALCEIVRLLDCDLVSRSWVVDDNEGRASGILIDPIDDFVSEREDERPLSTDEFIENGGVEMLFISYLLREDDLHKGNFGRDGERRVRRIDCDMLLWDVMYIFKGVRDPTGMLVTPPHKSFVITERDIRQFPKLSDASPFYWPTNGFYRFSTSPGKDKFFDLANSDDERVRERVFSCAVKFLCVPEETFASVLATHVRAPESMLSSPSGGVRNVREYVCAHLVSIQEELRQVITRMYEFIRYVAARGEQLEQWLSGEHEAYFQRPGTRRTFYDRRQMLNQWLWLRQDTLRNSAAALTTRTPSLPTLPQSRWSSVFKLPRVSSSLDIPTRSTRKSLSVSASADALFLGVVGANRRHSSPVPTIAVNIRNRHEDNDNTNSRRETDEESPSAFEQHVGGPIKTFFGSLADSIIFDDYTS